MLALMLVDVDDGQPVLNKVSPSCRADRYISAIVTDNVLGKTFIGGVAAATLVDLFRLF
jgi:hypothetical protein